MDVTMMIFFVPDGNQTTMDLVSGLGSRQDIFWQLGFVFLR